ncbi:hypothetical protein KA005_77855 [bacterium]|nr:hypothetical protein [bacterium]
MAKKKICFVISPIGEEESEVRKRSDQILKHVIEPPANECGYKAVRADKIDKPGIITSQVIQHVVEDPLIIADLTGHNPNVFYELAIRHAIRKPFIQIIKKGERIPFDVAGTRTINVDHHDLDSVGAAKNEIVNQIKSLEQDSNNIETPISVSLDLQILRQSDDPEHRSLADIMSALTELPSRIEGRLSERTEPTRRRKLRHFHPMMIEEMIDMSSMKSNDPIGVLIIASLLRDDVPWLYEIGIEAYRTAKSSTPKVAAEALRGFQRAIERTSHGPFMEEFMISSKETYRMIHKLSRILEHIIERYISARKPPSSRKK